MRNGGAARAFSPDVLPGGGGGGKCYNLDGDPGYFRNITATSLAWVYEWADDAAWKSDDDVQDQQQDDTPSGCTSATPLAWVSQPVVQSETALLVATTAPRPSVGKPVPMAFARLCPRTEAVGAAARAVACTFVPLRDHGQQRMPPSEPRNRSVVGCAFTIPPTATVHAWSVSLCASSDPQSCLATVRPLNVAHIDWVQGDRGNSSEAGGWLRVFGRALAFGPPTAASTGKRGLRCIPEREAAAGVTASHVRLRRAGSSSVWTALELSAASCYSINAKVPRSFLPGRYEMSLSNGIAGSAWVQSNETVTVVAKRSWPTEVFDVVKLGSVWKAMEAATNNSGGIVHFPRGTYSRIGETVILLHLPLPLVGVSIGIKRGVIKMTVSPTARHVHLR